MNAELEAAIDAVGRDKVFARAREMGWSAYNSPPEWVWFAIVRELQLERDNGVRRPISGPGGLTPVH